MVYPLALSNIAYRKPIIPFASIQLTENVMEQNLVGFPNSMYLHFGPYTPYFGSSYEGIMSVPTIWPPMSNPLANPMTPLKPILGIAQAEIVLDCKELWMRMMIILK